MIAVEAGFFSMGDARGDPDERPVRRLWLSSYEIDRHEVTREAYEACVAAGACRVAQAYPGLSAPDLPIVGVTWDDARAFCAWRGARLPSEAEWERAARGAADRRPYPWGETLDCQRANFGNFDGDGRCAGENPGRPLPVGSRPTGASPIGALDMAGNAWEWVADWYAPYDGRALRNPLGPARGAERVLRGGGCCSYFAPPRVSNRHRLAPEYADRDIGFRCARSLPASRSGREDQ